MSLSRIGCLLFSLALPVTALAAPQAQQQKTSPTPTPAKTTAGAGLIGGEHFVKRSVNDEAQGNIPAISLYLPETWKLDGKVTWNYGWTENPVALSIQATNPANAEAYFAYPLLKLESIQVPPNLRQYVKNQGKPGERTPMGAITLDPRPPAQAMALFVQRLRGKEANFKLVGKQDLPGLGKALGLDPWPGEQGIAVKVSYDFNGQPVEEAFYGLYYISTGGTGQIKQTNWGLRALQSFRAPAGTLDKRMVVFAAIAKSVHPTPEWGERAKAIDAKLVEAFNQKLKQGYDQIQASHALAQQVMNNEASFDKGVDAQIAANRASAAGGGGSSGGGRTVFDKADDLYRGVDTVNDPSTGDTTQRSFMNQYHWTDGFGNYRDTNDPNYDPSKDNAGNWTLMSTAQ
jgi:hypothetical protein